MTPLAWMIALPVACQSSPPCGTGTHEADGECVADEDTGSDADTDTDSDTDTDTDTDADTDTDTDTDSDTDTDTDTDSGAGPDLGPSGLLVFATVTTGCDTYTASAGMSYQDINAGGPQSSIEAITSASAPWVSALAEIPAGDAVSYTANFSAQCLGSSNGTLQTAAIGEHELLVVAADGYNGAGITAMWTAGVDYSATQVDVVFEDGTTTSYAESVLAGFAVTGTVQVSATPLLYRVSSSDGTPSVTLAGTLIAGDRVTYAVPTRL